MKIVIELKSEELNQPVDLQILLARASEIINSLQKNEHIAEITLDLKKN